MAHNRQMPLHNSTILVIDDEEIMREILETLLTREGYQVRLASTAMEGLELLRSMPFGAAIVDVMMPGMDGVTALDEIRKIDDDLPVLMITAYASVENAIAAMKRGAYDYISKPFKNDEVLVVLRNALAQHRLVAENRALRQNLQAHANHFGEIIGKSSRMRQVFDLIIQAAPSRTTILINGESGTGKELIARSLHQNSVRSDRAFITVNSDNLWVDGPMDALKLLASGWDEARMDALLLLVPLARANCHTGRGDFHMKADGALTRRRPRGVAPFVYTGIQMVSKRLFAGEMPEGPFSTNILWDRAIAAGRCFGTVHQGLWFDVGRPESIKQAEEILREG